MNRRKLISGSIASNIAMIAGIVTGVALTALVARYLGPAQFGIWAILNTVAHYAALVGVGLPAAITWRAASERGAGRPQASLDAIVAGVVLLGAVGIVAGGVVASSSRPLADFFNVAPELAVRFHGAVLALAVAISLGSVATSVVPALYGLEHLSAAAGLSVVASAVRLVASAAFLQAGWGLEGVIWGHVASHVVLIALGANQVWRTRSVGWTASARTIAGHFLHLAGFAANGAVLTIASSVTMTSAVLISGRLLSPPEVAAVAVVIMLAAYIVALVVSTLRPLEPRLASLSGANRTAEQHHLLYRSTLVSALMSFAMLVALVVLGKDVLVVWLGEAFSTAALPLSAAALAFSVAAAQVPVVTLIMATAKHRPYGWIVFVEALVNILLTMWLCREYGALGAVLGTALPLVLVRGFAIGLWGSRLLKFDLRRYALALAAPALAAALVIYPGHLLRSLIVVGPLAAISLGLPILMLSYASLLVGLLSWIDRNNGTDHLGFLLSLLPASVAGKISVLLGRAD